MLGSMKNIKSNKGIKRNRFTVLDKGTGGRDIWMRHEWRESTSESQEQGCGAKPSNQREQQVQRPQGQDTPVCEDQPKGQYYWVLWAGTKS